MTGRVAKIAATLAILALVAATYWPVHGAGLVWDDKIIFHDNAWLRYGDAWKQFIFRNFFDWSEYFRPLVVALFVFEARVFDALSTPMHLLSLALHLTNTLLVGLLARRLQTDHAGTRSCTPFLPCIAMLIYGVHPALIEPVVWISSQGELLLTFFVLGGLLCNAILRRTWVRAAAVGVFFFLAACCKESAVSFPPLLLFMDWLLIRTDDPSCSSRDRVRALWHRQVAVYACVLAAGLAYLGLRYWALGRMVHPAAHEAFFSFARLQTVSYTYLSYWRILLWPMRGLGPLHEVDMRQFAAVDAMSLAIDLAALAIAIGGTYLAWRRKPLGCAIVAVSVALFAVLHVVPVAFDGSLYHERYAMTALAMLCALLPLVVAEWLPRRRSWTIIASSAIVLWLGLALINIRVTLPLWSDETKLWQWVLQDYPASIVARDHLLSTYIETGDYRHARQLADALVAEDARCANCLINAASLAVAQGDAARASAALDKAKVLRTLSSQPRQIQGFVLATGGLRELQGDAKGAEEAYRDAIALEPFDPGAQMNLALLLARQSRVPEARAAFDKALALFAPEERSQRIVVFERTLAAAASRAPAAAPQPPR